MLFNSSIFIFAFLPITLLVFYLVGGRGHHRIAISWLVLASLFFYGWWNPAYLGLILSSILVNYAIGVALGSPGAVSARKLSLALGIIFNLGLLGYFKYANFFVDNFNTITGLHVPLDHIVLPLAISFFTFQQIAYLVDAYRGETREYNFLHYCLFVTFFPQLIAGPIVHHKEMLPQFARDLIYRFNYQHIAIGISIFALGLFKKVVIADGIATYATPVFDAAEAGVALTMLEAWGGALAYTFQLYFDFSGYSDMAIGLARMFGIKLPINFNSPYKAVNIIDFWRRWHITLSRFLRDYLYFPLGGNRKGLPRRYVNLIITMLLGGLWHGAGWTFVIWGGLHGMYLVIAHAWHWLRRQVSGQRNLRPSLAGKMAARTLTFFCVVMAWVVFRAESLDGAMAMYSGMLGYNGLSLPQVLDGKLGGLAQHLQEAGVVFHGLGTFGNNWGLVGIAVLLVMTWFLPNTQQYMGRFEPALDADTSGIASWASRVQWRPTLLHAVVVALLFFLAIKIMQEVGESEFLYFNF